MIRPDRIIEHHVQKIGGIIQIGPGINPLMASGYLVRHGGKGADLGQQAGNRQIDFFFLVDFQLRIKASKCGHHRGHDPHGMRSPGKILEKKLHILMNQGIVIEKDRELIQLLTVRQLPVYQQIGGFRKNGTLGQIFNRNPPISQNAFFSVHERDGAGTASGIGKAGIKSYQPGGPTQF